MTMQERHKTKSSRVGREKRTSRKNFVGCLCRKNKQVDFAAHFQG